MGMRIAMPAPTSDRSLSRCSLSSRGHGLDDASCMSVQQDAVGQSHVPIAADLFSEQSSCLGNKFPVVGGSCAQQVECGQAVAKVCLQLSFYNVLEKALTHSLEERSKRHRRYQDPEEEDESDFSIGEIFGADQHNVKTMHKKASRRQLIVLSFIRNDSPFSSC